MKWLQDRPWIWVVVTFIVISIMWYVAAKVAQKAAMVPVPVGG